MTFAIKHVLSKFKQIHSLALRSQSRNFMTNSNSRNHKAGITAPYQSTLLAGESGLTGSSASKRGSESIHSSVRHLETGKANQINPVNRPKRVVTMLAKLNETERKEQLEPLLTAGWALESNRDAITKEYTFKDFNEAFSFMAAVALLAEKTNHHPEWFNVYNRVKVTMSTHDVNGLSSKDIRMANFMETQAKRYL